MANLPEFRHIHCSSRFDRSAESLDDDLNDWGQESSLITLTEITTARRRAVLEARGWGYFCSVKSHGQDNCAVCWDKSVWDEQTHNIRRLTGAWRSTYHMLPGVWSATVVLKRKSSGHKLLVSVAHLPSDVQGVHKHWKTQDEFWRQRKEAYQHAMKSWSTSVNAQVARQRPDAALVCGDFNINFKLDWFQDYLIAHWGKNWRQAWKRFPTDGGSLHGGAVAPLGAPGKAQGDRIIDGTIYRGLEVTVEPNLMARTDSSDHRPYRENFQFRYPAGKGRVADPHDDGPATGDVHKKVDPWWGFGDYLDDEYYDIDRVFE